MIGDPFAAGAVHERFTRPLPEMPTGAVGTEGFAIGVTAAEFAEKAPVPTAFTAATWNR